MSIFGFLHGLESFEWCKQRTFKKVKTIVAFSVFSVSSNRLNGVRRGDYEYNE